MVIMERLEWLRKASKERVCQKSKTHPLFRFFIDFLHRITLSKRNILSSSDYARNLNGFGLTAIKTRTLAFQL